MFCLNADTVTDMEFVKNFTPPDFKAENFTPSIASNFNSFSKKKHKKWVKRERFTPLAKILHCHRQWRDGQIPPLQGGSGKHFWNRSNSKLFLSNKSFGKHLMFWCWIEESWWCCNAGEKRRKRQWCSISTPGQRRKDVLSFLSSRFATFLLSRIILKWRKNHCKISTLQAMVVRGVKPALVTLYDYYDKNEKWVFDIF